MPASHSQTPDLECLGSITWSLAMPDVSRHVWMDCGTGMTHATVPSHCLQPCKAVHLIISVSVITS